MKPPRRKVIARYGSAFGGSVTLSCGHSIVFAQFMSEAERRYKTMNCWKCARGECATHDVEDLPEGNNWRCKVCGITADGTIQPKSGP